MMATSQRNWRSKTFPLCNKGKQLRHWTLGLVNFGVMVGAIATSGTYAVAQIKPDGTLGAESSVVTPQVPGSSIDVISGGATRGANLFHSFEQFSVLTGREAFFNNAASIQNVISRVTGSSISNIDGLLRANARANLFLLNPNGIIFGPNARLDVGGSFAGSTADSLNFADGTQFSAKAPQSTPLLTVSVPIGLQYGGNAGRIANQSVASDSSGTPVGLQVKTGNTLTLAGSDVSLDGGRLTAPGGRVELGGVAQAGTIGLNGDGSLSYPEGVPRADVLLTNGSRVDVTKGSGGSIALNARNLDILAGSRLDGGIGSGLQSIDTQAGDITLNATGKITIANSVISNSVARGAVGNTGNINVKAESLSLADGAVLGSVTLGQGNAGNISLQVIGAVSLTGRGEPTGITSSVFSGAVGNSGNINLGGSREQGAI